MDSTQRLTTVLKTLSSRQKITLLVLSALIMSGFLVMILWSNQEEYSVLFSNLSADDAAAIVTKLKEQKTPYEISGGGSVVRVPGSRVYETRLELASQSLPRGGGVGFEIFDQFRVGTTEFDQKINYNRALQGELARTISQFKEIEGARVHLVLPKRSPFISEQEKARASVVVKLRHGYKLTASQVQGIVHLVASSVESLNPNDVTLVDTHGEILSGANSESDGLALSSSQLDYRRNVEKDLEKRIESMLEKVLGVGKAIARVSAAVDFKRIEKIEERYDPDASAIRSEQRSEENNQGMSVKAEGVPGAQSNLPTGQPSSSSTDMKNTFRRKNETVNYEVTRIKSSVMEPSGSLKSFSVAVLIDGAYKIEKNNDGKETSTYVPRAKEEMKKYEEIVKKAVGFSADRGDQVEVQNIPFERSGLGGEEMPATNWTWIKEYMPLIRYAGTAVLTLLFLLLVVKPLLKGLAGIRPLGSLGTKGTLLSESALALPEGETRRALEAPKDKEAELIEMAKKDPDHFAGLMKNWLRP